MDTHRKMIKRREARKKPLIFSRELLPDRFGCVHVGTDLSIPAIIEAYTNGCFPWTGKKPVPWFSPDPRLILLPEKFHLSRRMKRIIAQNRFSVDFDQCFRQVMVHCADIRRKNEKGTWITDNMIDVYSELFKLKIAHSAEVYDQHGQLCGGLYGLTFGRAFFGESMFSGKSNTSKLALYALCRFLQNKRFHFIDCQQVSYHLMSLGAVPVPRHEYLCRLDDALSHESLHCRWTKIDPSD